MQSETHSAANADSSAEERLPVSVITGFLGSGKTTLLNRLLQHPDLSDAAVIVNEFGEIGLDHSLIESANENTILLSSGCLCCTVRGDLVNTLRDLSVKRYRGEVPPFRRVVIETTGLADPAPILHTLMSVPVVRRYALNTVVTTVDAVLGVGTMDAQPESVKQAAVADRIVITKHDLVDEAAVQTLRQRLYRLNPAAEIHFSGSATLRPDHLFNSVVFDAAARSEAVRDWLRAEQYEQAQHLEHPEHPEHLEHSAHPGQHEHHAHHDHAHAEAACDHPQHGQAGHQCATDTAALRHDQRIHSFCLRYREPFDWPEVAAWLDSLVSARGEDLLRVKGLIHVRGNERPVVIHAVQHLFHPPVQLPQWPALSDHATEGLRDSRIVFITRDISRGEVEDALRGVRAALAERSASASV